jgi:DNA helicase-2/ATP-dependent DNA helicase PcrA
VNLFTGLMLPFMSEAVTATAWDVASRMASASGIIKELKQGQVPEEIDRLENLQELLNGIKEFTEAALTNGDPADIGSWLQSVSLLTDQDLEKPEDRNKVTLMTIHSAKGLEFKYVYIVGLEENLFPSNMNLYNPRELEEERRLFYVALTRACRRVTLSYALNRYRWGSLESSTPSRFIGEIESEYLWYPQTGGLPFGRRTASDSRSFDDSREVFTPTTTRKITRLRDATGGDSSGASDGMAGGASPGVAGDSAASTTGGAVGGASGSREEASGYTGGGASGSPEGTGGSARGSRSDDADGSAARGQGSAGSYAALAPGDRVRHERFGEGKVLSVDGAPPNTTAVIEFAAAGTRKLLLRFAKLRRI